MSAAAPIGQPTTEEFQVAVTGCTLTAGYVMLRYTVAPAPQVLVEVPHRRVQAEDAGIVLDSRRRAYRQCRSAYQLNADRTRVVGVIRFGPALWPATGTLRVLFAPLAQTAGWNRQLCEVRITLGGGAARVGDAQLVGVSATSRDRLVR